MRCTLFSLSLVLAGCIGLSLAACSGGNGGGSNGGCPSSPPSAGTPCFANGTTCPYGQTEGICGGGGSVAVCTNGTWTYEATGGPPGFLACPATIPTQGSPCTASGCGGAQPSCSYGCDQGGPAYATCNGSTWQVTREGAGCAVDAAVDVAADSSDGAAGNCRSGADCVGGAYCEAPGGPYLTGYALGPQCTDDSGCHSDSGVSACTGSATCVCQSTVYSPRPQSGTQAQGFCMAACAKDADCAAVPLAPLYGDGTGFVCSAGHCIPTACTAPSDCPAEFDCAANQCVRRSCAADTDCTPSGACVNGACRTGAGTCQPLPP
jgi:hypothetical protein